MPWLRRQRLAPRGPAVGVGDRLVDAVLRRAERRRRLADPVLVHEQLRQLEPVVERAEERVVAARARRSCVTSAWSVGMLNVHQKKSTEKPGASVGTRKALMPTGEPGSPDVRAKMMSWVAWCRPELKRLWPLRTHSSPSRTAVVSRKVASEPWFGSVSPNARRRVPSRKPGIHSAFCASVPKSRIISTVGKLPTIELSFCRSLWRPEALVGEVLADDRHLEVAGVAAAELRPAGRGAASRPRRRAGASRRAAPPSRARGTPSFSKSVRAHSRRWSKNRSLSSWAWSGAISCSMNASSSSRVAWMSVGMSKSIAGT